MNKKTYIIGGVALVILLVLVSPRTKFFSSDENTGASQPGIAQGLPVTAYVVTPGKIEDRIRATGTVLANEDVELKSETAGKITGILFREGSRVRKGEVLAKINDSELQASLQRAQSQVKLAEDKEQRRKILFEKNNISPEDYEVTLNELRSLRAEADLIRARIAKTEIRAPFDGVVGLRYVSEGSYVSTETKIASLLDVHKVKIDFTIPEKYANDVRKGQSITFTVAGSDKEYSGTVYAVEPKIDLNTRTLQLRAISANTDGRIIPGSFAEVVLVLGEEESALTIPTEALVPELQGQKVFLVKGGVASPQQVVTGTRSDRMVHVTSGIAPNDTVITSGILQLRPGMPVRITSITSSL